MFFGEKTKTVSGEVGSTHLVVSFSSSSSILLFLGSLSFPWVPRDLLLTTSQTPLNLSKASRGPWRPLAPSVDWISVVVVCQEDLPGKQYRSCFLFIPGIPLVSRVPLNTLVALPCCECLPGGVTKGFSGFPTLIEWFAFSSRQRRGRVVHLAERNPGRASFFFLFSFSSCTSFESLSTS